MAAFQDIVKQLLPALASQSKPVSQAEQAALSPEIPQISSDIRTGNFDCDSDDSGSRALSEVNPSKRKANVRAFDEVVGEKRARRNDSDSIAGESSSVKSAETLTDSNYVGPGPRTPHAEKLLDDLTSLFKSYEPEKESSSAIADMLAASWEQTLKSGLPLDEYESLMSFYSPPENLPALVVPKMNPEITVLSSQSRVRADKSDEQNQKVLSSALSALGQGMTMLLNMPLEGKKDLIQPFRDAACLVAALFWRISKSRKAKAMTLLPYHLIKMAESIPAGEFVIDGNLSEMMNKVKSVEATARSMRPALPKTAPNPRTQPPQPSPSTSGVSSQIRRPPVAGNFRGPAPRRGRREQHRGRIPQKTQNWNHRPRF
ncbi:Hypothetical protein NTJ_16246 [Nesidiocoris tenuis]|nr:Hypothetical protein NTJ_16246 [Nesidiocoris tenuis]